MKTPTLPLAMLSRWGTTMLLLVALAAGLTACYPGTVDNLTELDLIVTNYDTEFDFQSVRYYAMSDSVIDIGQSTENEIVYWPGGIPAAQRTIESQMSARGYERVPLDGCESLDCLPDGVDFVMMVGAVNSTTTVIGGGWGCYPYWGWGGCWGYPGCCSYAYSYETGTLLTNILVESTETPTLGLVEWNAGIQGVLSSSGASNTSRLENGLAQAFAQSPYLQAAPAAPAMTMVKGELR